MIASIGVALAMLATVIARIRHAEQAGDQGRKHTSKYTGWDMVFAAALAMAVMLLPAVHDPALSAADWLSGQVYSLVGGSAPVKAAPHAG